MKLSAIFPRNFIQENKKNYKYYSTIRSLSLIPAIGLEVHARLATSTKLFSKSKNESSKTPNSSVDFFDKLNKTPILLAIKSALALSCEFPKKCSFDRKHYFYLDQPSGYQITQHYHPLAKNGFIKLYKSNEKNQPELLIVKIKEIHLEQDTGKVSYLFNPSRSLIDFNRMGSSLIEIVTTPCLSSGKEAGETLKGIQYILRNIGASDANMEDGGLRCDVNVSIGNHPKCEIKNLANYEIKRQVSIINLGKKIEKQTLGYDIKKKATIELRDKEDTINYRYIPDPDLPEIILSKKLLKECKNSLPELQNVIFQKYLSYPYELPLKTIKTLVENHALDYFEKILRILGNPKDYSKITGNWIVNKLIGQLNIRNIPFKRNPVRPDKLASIIEAIKLEYITDISAKYILLDVINGDTREIYDIIKTFNYERTPDSYLMLETCQKIINIHKKQVDQYKSGQNKVLKWILGKVIKETHGRFPAIELEQLLQKIIDKNNI